MAQILYGVGAIPNGTPVEDVVACIRFPLSVADIWCRPIPFIQPICRAAVSSPSAKAATRDDDFHCIPDSAT
jgi:hypothetical protein